MDDLVAFLRARLDEREARAKAATQGQFGKWMVDEGKHYQDGRARQIVTMAYDPDYALVDESAWPGEQVLTNCSFDHSVDEQEEADLHFIADNDPQFVLADVAAKRQIIELHSGDGAHECPGLADFYGEATDYEIECRTLRLLAQPYAGHPEFREEWTA